MATNDPYSSLESRFHLSVLRAAQVVERGVNQALQPVGISSAQFYILLQLNRHPEPLTPKQIGAALLVERTNLTLILDRMERDGLVQRERNPGDRRSVLIRLTDIGRDTVNQAIAAYGQAMPALLTELDSDAIRSVIQTLGGMADAAATAVTVQRTGLQELTAGRRS